MSSPDALHLRFAAAGQLRRPADTVAARPEDNDAFVCHQVSLASGIFPAREVELKHGDSDEAKKMAQKIIDDQTREIGEFQQWLEANAK
jgi:uncharacterized protein (DUF305 family)